jgi:hypothetical protein
MNSQKVIRNQAEFEQHSPGTPTEENRRKWHSQYRFDENAVVELTDAPLDLPQGLETHRARIILGAVQSGRTVGEINKAAKKIHEHAEPDGDVWIAIKRGYARLK